MDDFVRCVRPMLSFSIGFNCIQVYFINHPLPSFGTPRVIKTRLPMEQKNGVVYHIKCENCDAECIGETEGRLDTRLEEYWSVFESLCKSAIFAHTTQHQPLHSVDYKPRSTVAPSEQRKLSLTIPLIGKMFASLISIALVLQKNREVLHIYHLWTTTRETTWRQFTRL